MFIEASIAENRANASTITSCIAGPHNTSRRVGWHVPVLSGRVINLTRVLPFVRRPWHQNAIRSLKDCRRLIRALTQRDFTKQQAEAITDAIQEIDLESLATKADLKAEIGSLETRLTLRMATFVSVGVAVQSAIIAAIQVLSSQV